MVFLTLLLSSLNSFITMGWYDTGWQFFDVIYTLALPLLSQRTLHNYVCVSSFPALLSFSHALALPLAHSLFYTRFFSLQLIPLALMFLLYLLFSHWTYFSWTCLSFCSQHSSSFFCLPSKVQHLILLKLMTFNLLLIFIPNFLSPCVHAL